MIFRAFFGEPCEEARELEHGHLHHADVPRNPMTGEEEDTDVGFPGPGHFIAEREYPMKIAMSALAVLAVIGGLIQIPGVDDAVTKFLEPTFADSKYVHVEVSTGPAWLGSDHRRADRDRRHHDRLPHLGRTRRHLDARCASGSPASTCSSRTSGTSMS